MADTADTTDSAPAVRPMAALNARAAAVALGVSERTVRRAIVRGALPATKYAGAYRIAPAALESFRRRLTAPTPLPRPARATMTPIATGIARGRPASSAWRSPLPVPLTSLIDRDRELAAVSDLLRHDGVRLVTLIGPGGVGKTRLALRLTEQIATEYPEGVWFVALAPIRDPDLIAPTIVHAMGVVERADRLPIETLTAHVRDRTILLVLDNFCATRHPLSRSRGLWGVSEMARRPLTDGCRRRMMHRHGPCSSQDRP